MREPDTFQRNLDLFRIQNRYEGSREDHQSKTVFAQPRRTLINGWLKFHADRQCGNNRLRYIEANSHKPAADRFEFKIHCAQCGYEVPEEEVLFIGGEWFREVGWKAIQKPLENLHLPEDRVLELGPDPDRDMLIDALELTRIEESASIPHMFSFGRDFDPETCATCGKDTPITFGDECRLCFDREMTPRMQESLKGFSTAVLERNNSFKHRLKKKLPPSTPSGKAMQGAILWRRRTSEDAPKLVIVAHRLQDEDSGDWHYLLEDLSGTTIGRYTTEALDEQFWETGLFSQEGDPLNDERIEEVYERVCPSV